jgi:outer membrane protein assembly factor BamD (BamD/ComL family)
MKLKPIFVVLIALALVGACAPKPVTTPGPYQMTREDELFSRAEKLFESQSYEEALALYDEYVSQYPAKPLAAAALMKIGIIHAFKEDYDAARAAFQNIVSTYPTSPFVPDAMVEELYTYYQQEQAQSLRASGGTEEVEPQED